MATIMTGLALHDQMTSVVNGITNSLNLTIAAMDDMQNSVDRTFDSRAIEGARSAIQQTEASIQNLTPPTNDAEKAQRQLNNEMKNGQTAADGLAKTVGKIAVALAPVIAISKVVKGGFDRLVGIDTATAKLQALGHSGESVDTIMGNAITSVTGTAFRMEEAANTAASAVAAGIKPGQQLEKYLSLTADAAAIAGTNMGEMGAIFNKITTSGRIQAQELNQISDRGIPIFQMLADEMGVAAEEIRGLASDGQVSSDIFLRAIESGFGGAAQAMGTASLRATLDNIGAAISRIGANFLNGANDGQGFFDQVKPLMVNLLEALKNLESRAAEIGKVFGTVFKTIHENWSLIGPVIWGVVSALGAYLVVTKAVTAAIAIKNAVMAVNPYYAIAMAVTALTVILIRLWKTNDAFAAGFMRAWNGVLNFFDKIPIFFAKVGLGISNAFDDAKVTSLKIIQDLVNGVIDNVNKLINLLNKIPGVSIDAINHFELTASAEVEAEAKRQAREDQIAEMEESAALRAAEREQKVLERLESRAAKRAQEEAEKESTTPSWAETPLAGLDNLDHIDTVGEVGRINDSVDISSEDLKMMRELAEMRNVQNFVTLQPQMSFGDTNIRQDGRSVDEIVANITERLNEEIASSAKGVYSLA